MLSLDQLHVLLAVVEEGSFSAAARRLGRAQSAVTYAIQELERDVGLSLFDRTGYRPSLTEAGRGLLPRARRIVAEAAAFAAQAEGMVGGLEAKLTLVIDAMFPFDMLSAPLSEFQGRFPSVRADLHVDTLGATGDMVIAGEADLGLVISFFTDFERLDAVAAAEVELAPVCSPSHPLAHLQLEKGAPLTPADVSEHLQLVLIDRSPRTGRRDYGIASSTTWRLGDLGAKLAMIRAGLGWGSLPRHMIASDIAQRKLVGLQFDRWPGSAGLPKLEAALVRPRDARAGPAALWLYERLSSLGPGRSGVCS